jgi:hypothetical protein
MTGADTYHCSIEDRVVNAIRADFGFCIGREVMIGNLAVTIAPHTARIFEVADELFFLGPRNSKESEANTRGYQATEKREKRYRRADELIMRIRSKMPCESAIVGVFFFNSNLDNREEIQNGRHYLVCFAKNKRTGLTL